MGLGKRETERLHDLLVRSVHDEEPEPTAAAERAFGLSRRSLRKHLERLSEQGRLVARGPRTRRRYDVAPWCLERASVDPAHERPARTWLEWLGPALVDRTPEARDAFWYGLEELLANAAEHAPGAGVSLQLVRTVFGDTLMIEDDGPGAFQVLSDAGGFAGAAEAALAWAAGQAGGVGLHELARLFEHVALEANGVRLEQRGPGTAWRLGAPHGGSLGTRIALTLDAGASRGLAPLADPDRSPERRSAWLPARYVGDTDLAPSLLRSAAGLDELTVDFSGVETLARELSELLFGAARPAEAPPVRRASASRAVDETIRASLLAARQRK